MCEEYYNNPSVEIFSQGEEIVTGQTVDTNAAWLSEQLVQMGFDVTRHTAVGDRIEALIALLAEIAERADCCICSGGLGPTDDDLTAEAVAAAFERPLQQDPIALRNIRSCFDRWHREMPDVNRKQALLPNGAIRLDNDWGTAPGFALQHRRCWFAFVPGVPSEMRNMFKKHIKSNLRERFELKPWRLIKLRSTGIGESAIQERLDTLQFPENMLLSFRAGLPEIQTKLLFPPGFSEPAMREFALQAATAIGKCVFCIDGLDEAGGDLAWVVGKALQENSLSLAAVETLSAGRIASQCGDSGSLLESVVVTNPGRFEQRFGIDLSAVTNDNSAVRQTVLSVARDMHTESGADIVLAQLWNFDMQALQDEALSVQLYNALVTQDSERWYQCSLGGSSQRKQIVAAAIGLDMLRRHLLGDGSLDQRKP